jgi:hypothetical protein
LEKCGQPLSRARISISETSELDRGGRSGGDVCSGAWWRRQKCCDIKKHLHS